VLRNNQQVVNIAENILVVLGAVRLDSGPPWRSIFLKSGGIMSSSRNSKAGRMFFISFSFASCVPVDHKRLLHTLREFHSVLVSALPVP
jgi:hypothetical protein